MSAIGATPSVAAPPSLSQRAARSIRHPLSRTLLVLTFTTGLVDAVSYLGIGHVFTANMTGNIVFLGFGIAGSGGLPVVAPLISLAAFLAGAGAGGVLASRFADRNPQHMARALGIEVILVALAAILAATITIRANAVSGDVVIALLAFAMGVRNATIRRVSVPDLTTTVLTMTLTGLAADSPLFGGSGKGSVRRISAVIAMLLGALAGALLLKTSLALPLAVAAGLALLSFLTYPPAARREAAASHH
ncbi:MAG TPA: YoaK family protein [Solirubrobacteraceae bacterium]|nr:YoaK family protein [Solirubrobacteraceae bacterium]